ncbi:unnamed protein product [Psylliodes chrysocephalus]|uniref:Uncharacterized protein n=1 Tax=Psylliodes chrysocephalus TaxID=3402493 RepID=A0A9P0CJA3_9CUCU|nr:unnamed protein product [Psylliodes chrysocephala]
MDWFSHNVPQGGMMQTAKNTYNPDTAKYLKLLIDESKMTSMLRKKDNYILRNNEPLPSLSEPPSRTARYPVTIRPGSSKKRSMDTIIKSGVYEREQFKPIHPLVDREKEKEKLQNKMAFNSDVKVKKDKALEKKVSKEIRVEYNRFDQLMQEIKERENWLKEMERLGEADKYRQVIENQIQEKVRELDRMKTCNDMVET